MIAVAAFAFSLIGLDHAYASCISENEIDWDAVLSESESAFTGTVTRLDNYDGPQKVTFLIHDVIKGNINTPKHVLENSELTFLENDSVMSSSIDVGYKIGNTYKVYVTNGVTNQCTTKIVSPPAGYMWEPGPEDGNYYSDENGMVGMAFNSSTPIAYYNTALLEAAGVEPPAEGTSWSFTEFLEACEAIQASGVPYCIALGQVGRCPEQ